MKTRKFIVIILLLFVFIRNVSAEKHDVQAKYTITYNVKAYSGIIENNEIEIPFLGNVLIFKSDMPHVKVVIIKMENEANNYAEKITQSNENYYIEFRDIHNKKIIDSNIKIKIKDKNNILNLYDKDGIIIDKSSNFITLSKNDYLFSIKNKIYLNEDGYLLLDENTQINEIPSIDLEDAQEIEIYNSKGKQVEKNDFLGTGYVIIVKSQAKEEQFNIVVKGDTTGDSKINLNDVTRLYHYYKSIEEMSEPYILAGDVAKNGEISLNDITKIYHYYKKIINDL